jgi:hypothetical protein
VTNASVKRGLQIKTEMFTDYSIKEEFILYPWVHYLKLLNDT